jgi:hypothetical protein
MKQISHLSVSMRLFLGREKQKRPYCFLSCLGDLILYFACPYLSLITQHVCQVSESLVPNMTLDTILSQARCLQSLMASSWPESESLSKEHHGETENSGPEDSGQTRGNMLNKSKRLGNEHCAPLKVFICASTCVHTLYLLNYHAERTGFAQPRRYVGKYARVCV